MPPRKKTTKKGRKEKTKVGEIEVNSEENSLRPVDVNNEHTQPPTAAASAAESQISSSAIDSITSKNSISIASSFKARGRRRRSTPQSKSDGLNLGQAASAARQQNSRKSCAKNSTTENKLTSSPSNQPQITQYFPIRRSCRKMETEIKKEGDEELEKLIESKMQSGLEIKEFDGKGRGIVTTRAFQRKDFVVEYAGELVDVPEAKDREVDYLVGQKGCYMYYFNHKDKNYCVDATAESEFYGRLVNHSRRRPNCVVKVVEVKGKPHLVLLALRDIDIGEEILYDYGDRSKESLMAHPWLAL